MEYLLFESCTFETVRAVVHHRNKQCFFSCLSVHYTKYKKLEERKKNGHFAQKQLLKTQKSAKAKVFGSKYHGGGKEER